jgi:hypothetical protein
MTRFAATAIAKRSPTCFSPCINQSFLDCCEAQSESDLGQPCQSLAGAAGPPLKADLLAGSRLVRVGPQD